MQRWFWLGLCVVIGIITAGVILQQIQGNNRIQTTQTKSQTPPQQATAQAQAPQPTTQPQPSQQAAHGSRMLPHPEQPLRYVALGDSTVYGTGASSPEKTYVGRISARLEERYPATDTTNLGVNGATAADVVANQLPQAVELDPMLVTLSVGPNDVTRGRDVAAYERDIATIFRTLHEQTDAVVVVNLLPDLAVSPRLTPQQQALAGTLVKNFNNALARQAQQYDVAVVDLYTPSHESVPNNPALLADDFYHPSDEGYERWAELMWTGIATRLPES